MEIVCNCLKYWGELRFNLNTDCSKYYWIFMVQKEHGNLQRDGIAIEYWEQPIK